MNYKKLCIALVAAAGLLLLIGAQRMDKGGPEGRVLTDVTANADKTADFQGNTIDTAGLKVLTATVNATEDSGTATVDITIQSSADHVTWFTTGTTFTQLAATGTETKSIATGVFHRFVRYDFDFTGSGQYDLDMHTTVKP